MVFELRSNITACLYYLSNLENRSIKSMYYYWSYIMINCAENGR